MESLPSADGVFCPLWAIEVWPYLIERCDGAHCLKRDHPAALAVRCTEAPGATHYFDSDVIGLDPLSMRLPISNASSIRQLQARRHVDESRQAIGLHLLHHSAPVCLDGDLADTELGSHLLVQ